MAAAVTANVGELTGANWKKMAADCHAGVVFYTDESAGSLTAAANWDKVMAEYAMNPTEHILVGKVDCAKEKVICDQDRISEFPALRFGAPQ